MDEVSDSILDVATLYIDGYFSGTIKCDDKDELQQYFNCYVKHIVNRVVNNKVLKGKYLCNIYCIYVFLTNKGINNLDIPKIITNERWKNTIISELDYCSEREVILMAKASNLGDYNIENEVLLRAEKSYKFNYRDYLYLIYNSKTLVDDILNVFGKKADCVNIKYPVVTPKDKVSGEYIVLVNLLAIRKERTIKYESILEYVLGSSNGKLAMAALNNLKNYDKSFRTTLRKERINEILYDATDKEYINALQEILESFSKGDFNEGF